MNIHVPQEILEKYPNMEFRGKPRIMKNRSVIEALCPATDDTFFYSFEEDFFWIPDSIPDWKLKQ
jgi:hypothetical protein